MSSTLVGVTTGHVLGVVHGHGHGHDRVGVGVGVET